MYTNQEATPGVEQFAERGCIHLPGMGTAQTCAYLRALARIEDWTEQASRAHAACEGERELLGLLWVLHAELAYALDHCPNARRADVEDGQAALAYVAGIDPAAGEVTVGRAQPGPG
jgi:hypothetical protein